MAVVQEVVRLVPQEHVQQRIDEQLVVVVPVLAHAMEEHFMFRFVRCPTRFRNIPRAGKSFLTQKHGLGECSKKIDALREQKSGILGQVRDRVAKEPAQRWEEAHGRDCRSRAA